MENLIYCTSCGARNNLESRFCSACGKQIQGVGADSHTYEDGLPSELQPHNTLNDEKGKRPSIWERKLKSAQPTGLKTTIGVFMIIIGIILIPTGVGLIISWALFWAAYRLIKEGHL